MPGIDSLLRMMISNQADELRVAAGTVPKMLRRGSAVRLSMPVTDEETLRHLIGELLTPERESALGTAGKVAFDYSAGGERYLASFQGTPQAFEASFRHVAQPAPVAAPVAAPVIAAVQREVRPSAVEESAVGLALQALLERAAKAGASDLHLCSGEPPMWRVDGRLRQMSDVPAATVQRALGELLPAGPPTGRSIDKAFAIEGVGRFRANLYRASNRVAAAIRLLPASAPSLEQLGLPPLLAELVDAPHGLILVCGPTGAGKSATLAALAQEALGRRGGLLITLEDPVEYAIKAPPAGLVRQRQVGDDVPDFSTGLRDALREDPDILLVGEMRDAESISLALTAAETGHLVLASLHSRSSASTVQRIVDAYAPERQRQARGQLADSLHAVLCQRLLPRARGAGRVAALEIMRGTHGVAALIRDGKTEQLASTIQSSRKEGMIPLERGLADLVRSGQIERDDAIAAANDQAALMTFLSS